MKFGEFVKMAIKTESIKKPLKGEMENLGLNNRIMHCIIGAATEKYEFDDAMDAKDRVNALEELGDMLWYGAILYDEIGYDTNIVYDMSFPSHGLDMIKKTLFYGKELDIYELRSYGNNLLSYAVTTIRFLGGNEEDVMDTIIAKLKARYGDKFMDSRAEKRDLNKEREILEEGLKNKES